MRGIEDGTDGTNHHTGRAVDRDGLTDLQWMVWYMIVWGYLICCAAVFCTGSAARPSPMPEKFAAAFSFQDATASQVLAVWEHSTGTVSEMTDFLVKTMPNSAARNQDEPVPPKPAEGPVTNAYVDQLVQEILGHIYTPDMTEYERAKAAYDWILNTATEEDPIGFDIWRVHSEDPNTPIPYLENRALSLFRYHVGKCEEMSAALILLLRGMEMEAEYIPGFIFSLEDEPMDHAWAMVKVDGEWYHIDPNMECYRSRRNTVRYLYFLKGDGTMRYTHCWGEHIIYTSWLTAAQKEEVSQNYMGHPCSQDYTVPEARDRDPITAPDIALLRQEIDAELAAYEKTHGPLPPIELDTAPPVFGFEGYGPDIY